MLWYRFKWEQFTIAQITANNIGGGGLSCVAVELLFSILVCLYMFCGMAVTNTLQLYSTIRNLIFAKDFDTILS